MKLRFYAKADLLVTDPEERRMVGSHARYIGRAVKMIDGRAAYPATREPCEREDGDDIARRLVKICSRGDLWPADEATAKRCGVPFVDVAWTDGAWLQSVAKPEPEKPPKLSGGSKKDS